MYKASFDPAKILRAADAVVRSIIEQKTDNYRRSDTPGVFITDIDLGSHMKEELAVIEQLWRETLSNYEHTRRAKIELDNMFL